MPLRTRCGTSRLPCMSLGVRAQGLGPRGGGTALAITICSVLPSVPYDAVGPPKFILLSRLNIQPARLPVNASPLLSRTTTHDSGPIWFAITICSVLPSVPYDAVGPPKFILLSRLNIQPARLPVNASPLLSRTTTHDSGPIWFATPSLGGTCTRETYRFVPAHREVKILMCVVSKNTNELKTGLPGRFGIDVSTLGSQHLNDRVDFSGIAG